MSAMLKAVVSVLDAIGQFLPQLLIRLILGWEFLESGLVKFHATSHGWFDQLSFPFPFSLLSANTNWNLTTWTELAGSVLLILGLFTRLTTCALIMVTVIAIATVHWPEQWNSLSELLKGYAIRNEGFGNYKLPVIFLVMLAVPLFIGPGKLSLDHLFFGRLFQRGTRDTF